MSAAHYPSWPGVRSSLGNELIVVVSRSQQSLCSHRDSKDLEGIGGPSIESAFECGKPRGEVRCDGDGEGDGEGEGEVEMWDIG